MKLVKIIAVVALLGCAALALPAVIYFESSWNAIAKGDVGVFRLESDAAYAGSLNIETAPAISALKVI